MAHSNSFFEIAAILTLSTLLGIVGQKLRQPLIIMFLMAGILAGPLFFGIIESYQQIELLAHIGIALLLFIVGLRLDLNLIRTTGKVALATGMGQIFFTSTIGYALSLLLGMSIINAAYVAVALTFSSTIIIVKLLSDKKEIDSLHGQIAVGFLIVQDIAAILALVGLTTIGASATNEHTALHTAALILAKGMGLLGVVGLMRFVMPHLTRWLAHSQELLMIFAITWAVSLGAGSEMLGFSKEVGAFLAGVSLASTGYREAIGSRLTGLRDFLLLFFFIDLGARLDLTTVGSQLESSLLLSLFVLIGNPLIVVAIMGFMGYRRRTGFLAGLTVAQISEFSLIVAALGLNLGHITQETMGLITLVGLITIFSSTYLILYSSQIYRLLVNPLKIFERKNPYREATLDSLTAKPAIDVILVGLGNYGSNVAEYLLRRNKVVFGVDFDPSTLEKWAARDMSVLYGDMADPEIYEQLPLNSAQWVVSTVRSSELNLALIQHLKDRGYTGKLGLTAVNQQEAVFYEKSGATVVFRPFADAAEQAADELAYAMDILPRDINWPIGFREVRIRRDTTFVGKQIKDIPLRAQTGASILAVIRAGAINYNPAPLDVIHAGDYLIIMGSIEELRQADTMLQRFRLDGKAENEPEHLVVTELRISNNSSLVDKTLSETQFRQKFGVTIVGIRREDKQIMTPAPTERLYADDSLIVIGDAAAINTLKHTGSL